MTEAEIQHFLIVYDIPTGKAQVHDFGADYDAAQAAYHRFRPPTLCPGRNSP